MKQIFISPHDDDHALFGAFTCIREKPLVFVVFDSYKQPLRGEKGCSKEERREETEKSCEILGISMVARGNLPDSLNPDLKRSYVLDTFKELEKMKPEVIYAPADQGGNEDHDIISLLAGEIFGDRVKYYTTYSRNELWTKGNEEIVPTEEELLTKKKSLDCYVSQINLPATRPHFEAVYEKSEWFI